jgi:hypothetical protein
MRLKSEIWVHAFLRRAFVEGRYGAVLRKGAPEAGAVYVVVNRLDGTIRLLGPPPGPAIDEQGERRFTEVVPKVTMMEELGKFTERMAKFDPDFWIVEVEDRSGTAGIAILPA